MSGHSIGIGNSGMTSVAEECEFQFQVLHKAEHGGPPQFKGEWSKGPDGIVDASIYFRSTLAGGFQVGDVVAGHKVGLPISELCTSVHAARSQFPWVLHGCNIGCRV
jgi:hypothetical protein